MRNDRPRCTRPRRLERHPPVQFAVGSPGKAPLTAEMEFRDLRIADRPAAIVPLEGGYGLVLLLGHDTSLCLAHCAAMVIAPVGASSTIWGRSLCVAISGELKRLFFLIIPAIAPAMASLRQHGKRRPKSCTSNRLHGLLWNSATSVTHSVAALTSFKHPIDRQKAFFS